MRKYIFFMVLVTFTALLASCTAEDTMNAPAEESRIRISAELPKASISTRGQITVDANHQLRCILEIWSKEEASALQFRKEVVVEAGQTPVFDFSLKSGDYNCLLWADFIKRGAPVEKVIQADGLAYDHYEDTYYDTQELKDIKIKGENAVNMFDTDNCDAFFSRQVLEKQEGESLSFAFTMERPLAKFVVKEKEAAQFAKLKKLSVSFNMPQGFDVSTGEPTGRNVPALFAKTFSNDNSRTLFSSYVFVPSQGEKAMETVALGLTTSSLRNCEIPSGSILLKRNQCTNATGTLITGKGIEPKSGEYLKAGDKSLILISYEK